MEKKATITDVAREVGVSKTTISRYLNGSFEYMSDKTKTRIETVIRELNYVPNSVARTLKSKRSMLIGVIVNTRRYQVAAQTAKGIHDICAKNGYGTVLCCSDDDPDKELQAIQLCLNQQVDGLVIIPCMESSQRYLELCRQGIPVVLIGREDSMIPEALEQFLGEYPGQRKAVLAVNTHTLFLVLKELERRKVRIPEELGVCGYDAIGWSELLHVTSMRQPMDRMGLLAGEKMIQCLREGGMSQGRAALEGTLAFRRSTQLSGSE